jgi:hypothetical protein
MDNKVETAVEEIKKALEEELNPNTLLFIFQRVRTIIDNNGKIDKILENFRILKTIRYFLCDKDSEVRVAALRTLRYLSISEKILIMIINSKLLHFIIRSFETEGKSHERIEACKIIKN